jgi:hypothetical protein
MIAGRFLPINGDPVADKSRSCLSTQPESPSVIFGCGKSIEESIVRSLFLIGGSAGL